jgi:D-alanine-D-alanine ligase-like ATP-grasp enzyme
MDNMDAGYLPTIKTMLTGSPDTPLVLVCNFEAEANWAHGHVGLPTPTMSTSNALVATMEELGLLLAGPHDALLLNRPVDPGYLAYLAELGLAAPTTLTPENHRPDRSTAENALDSPLLLARLRALADAGARLLPMGTTADEQKLADACGLPLAVPGPAVFERVNSKIYGRRLAEAAGLRPVPGANCESRQEFADVLARYRTGLTDRPVVVKDAYGVSGKGLIVLDHPDRADRLLRMVQRRADRGGDDRLAVVVEEWLPKRCDLNYQVTVARDGRSRFDFVKQAITENGVHKGHLMPAELSSAQLAEIEHAASLVAGRLHADGFHGVVGVDAIVGADETIYPVLEINARLNMSSYQGALTERFQPAGHVALARHYPVRLTAPISFAGVRRVLGRLADPDPERRLLITCFATVNANAGSGTGPFDGRLYALLVARDRERLDALDAATEAALAQLPTLGETP